MNSHSSSPAHSNTKPSQDAMTWIPPLEEIIGDNAEKTTVSIDGKKLCVLIANAEEKEHNIKAVFVHEQSFFDLLQASKNNNKKKIETILELVYPKKTVNHKPAESSANHIKTTIDKHRFTQQEIIKRAEAEAPKNRPKSEGGIFTNANTVFLSVDFAKSLLSILIKNPTELGYANKRPAFNYLKQLEAHIESLTQIEKTCNLAINLPQKPELNKASEEKAAAKKALEMRRAASAARRASDKDTRSTQDNSSSTSNITGTLMTTSSASNSNQANNTDSLQTDGSRKRSRSPDKSEDGLEESHKHPRTDQMAPQTTLHNSSIQSGAHPVSFPATAGAYQNTAALQPAHLQQSFHPQQFFHSQQSPHSQAASRNTTFGNSSMQSNSSQNNNDDVQYMDDEAIVNSFLL